MGKWCVFKVRNPGLASPSPSVTLTLTLALTLILTLSPTVAYPTNFWVIYS